MIIPAIPANEFERMADLYDYGILDSPAEKVFDEIAQLAAMICGTQFAAVTLIDRGRQWFKSEYGLHFGETARDESICGHAILENEVFVVSDTKSDERFAGNPLLEGHPEIRFYGGSQLMSHRGNAIGMLCVMDSSPQQLDAEQRRSLRQLADVLMAVLDAGRKMRVASWFGTLLDNVQDEILIIDPTSLRYLHANRATQERLGYSLDEMQRLTPMQIARDDDRLKFEGYVERLQSGEPFITFEASRYRADGQTYPVESRWQLLSTAGRSVVLAIVHDITERRQAEQLKDEFITRVRNELELAREMQRGLLPPPGNVLGGEMAWFFQASSFVGGDAFDYLRVDEHRLAFFMLDVAGHGVSAAMVALGAQRQLHVLARQIAGTMLEKGSRLEEAAVAVVTEFNRRRLEQRDWDLFLTLIFGLYDRQAHQVALVPAGHPAPLFATAGSATFVTIGEGALPVGISYDAGYEATVIDAPPGSRIVMLSDGVVECVDAGGIEYGTERLLQLLEGMHGKPIAEHAAAVGAELERWRGNASFDDDVTFLIMETC